MANWIDHLVLAAPTLEAGIDHVRSLTGVAPVFGGRHEGAGTHNALLSLGEVSYLEVLAVDPTQTTPSPLLGTAALEHPRLHGFAVGCDDLDAAVADLRAGGFDTVSDPFAMTRAAPDGRELAWRLAFVGAPAGALPFLISWGDTPSPASTSPVGGRLVAVAAGDPNPDAARALLGALGLEVAVEHSPSPWLRATIETAEGTIELT